MRVVTDCLVIVLRCGYAMIDAKRVTQASGLIGCHPKEIVTTATGMHSYIAECRGRKFYCSKVPHGEASGCVVRRLSSRGIAVFL